MTSANTRHGYFSRVLGELDISAAKIQRATGICRFRIGRILGGSEVYLHEALAFELLLAIPRQLWIAEPYPSMPAAEAAATEFGRVMPALVDGSLSLVSSDGHCRLVPGEPPTGVVARQPSAWEAFLGRKVVAGEVPALLSAYGSAFESIAPASLEAVADGR